ncbi:hypothetical protein EV175_003316 [Coemansia sp. RSA 1933]|nr:hypothetical protein EV175_003316 [Coemansia sp. RSA 1933]
MDTHEKLTLSVTNSETVVFSDEPLLLRLDIATYAFYQTLGEDDACEKKMLELAASFANVTVQTRLVGKKEMKKYKRPGKQAATRDIMSKYQDREKQLLQSGTWDMQWGLRWLLSFIVLIDTPVLSISNAKAMLSVVNRWLRALRDANIQEVEGQFAELEHTLSVADDELVASLSASRSLPGKFNAACSLIFAGELKEAFVDLHMPKWALTDYVINTEHRATAAHDTSTSGLSLADARDCVAQVFGSEDLSQITCTCSIACDLRVNEITQDLSPFRRVSAYMFNRTTLADQGDPLVLYLEHEIAAELRPGFVLEATLHTLNNGYNYIDAVTMVWPSYTPLDYVDGA